MQEKTKIVCKICREIKERILVGKFNEKDKKWADEEGRLFNGHTCPSCHKKKILENMNKLNKSRREQHA